MYEFSTIGALAGLVLAIVLIILHFQPAYSLILGAFVGAIAGGGGLSAAVNAMISGASGMISSILRIMTSGILAGALIKTGSAQKIATSIAKRMGSRFALPAISIATMIICFAGVFVDISVITVAPIALAIGRETRLSKESLLVAMTGGGKAGNIISPNPNTIATAEAFGVDLTALMLKNIIPALCALAATIALSMLLSKKQGIPVGETDSESGSADLPGFVPAILGPATAIALLALRPIAGISVDPLIALPAGGLVCILATRHGKEIREISEAGLSKVIGVSVLLVGTGTIAGVIKASALQSDMTALLERLSMPTFELAPLAGILMAAATASTTAGATIASQTFAETLVTQGVPPLSAGAMIHSSSTVLDSLPHGSFFHATGGSVSLQIKDRMRLIPYEACIGLTATAASIVLYLVSA